MLVPSILAALAIAAGGVAPDPGADVGGIAAGGASSEVGAFRYAAIPAVAYGSDVGLAIGVASFAYRAGSVEGRFDRLTLSGAYTTRGPRSLLLRWDQPRLRDSRWGLDADLRLSDDNQQPYWGEGAGLAGASVAPGSGSPPDPFRFHDRRLFLSVTLRPAPTPRPLPYFRLRWLGVDVADAGALLGSTRPFGWEGGGTLLSEVGLVVDTRDREVGTRRGWHAYVSAFGVPSLGSFSLGPFGGVDLFASAFAPLTRRLVLAARVLYDGKFGDVPFFERYGYEGLAYGGGLGGAGTIRGVARQRIAGDQKALATVELRATFAETLLFDRFPLEVGAAAGADAGVARQRGYSAVSAVGAFAGLRAVWDRAVVVRLEVGYAGQEGAAVYFVTGEQF